MARKPQFKSPVGGTRNTVKPGGIYVGVVEHVAGTTTSTRRAGMARVRVPFFNNIYDYAPVGGQSPRDPLVRGDLVYVAFLDGRLDQLVVMGRVDHQTDVFAPTSNPIFTGTVEVPLLLSDGIGIGTTAPVGLLHVSAGTSGDAVVIIESNTDDNADGDNPRLLFRQDGGNDWSAIHQENDHLYISNSIGGTSGGIIFATNNSSTNGYLDAVERMRISYDGAVTIAGDLTVNGTTTEINSTTLTVDDKNIVLGSVATPSDTTADGGGITLKGATDKTIVWVNSKDAWDFNQGINVTGSVSITGNLTVSTSNAQILGPESGAATDENVSYSFHNDTDTGLYRFDHNTVAMATGGYARMTWGATGNVGIGTTDPAAALDIGIGPNTWTTSSWGSAIKVLAGDAIRWSTSSSTNWGLGVSGNKLYFIESDGADDGSAANYLMVLEEGGNVGINDATPSYKLDVNGTGHFTGVLTLGSSIDGPEDFIVGNGAGEQMLFQGSTNITFFMSNGVYRAYFNSSGHFHPYTDNGGVGVYDLGGSSLRWKGLYAVTGNFTGAVTLDSVAISNVDSGSSFTDNDVSIMTSAAIADKIESYGYTTVSGEITGIVTSTGISGGTTSGTATLSIDADQSQVTAVGTLGSLNVTGNVGIGTTTPYSILDIQATGVGWGEGISVRPSSGGFSQINFRHESYAGGSTNSVFVGRNQSGATDLFTIMCQGMSGSALHRADSLLDIAPYTGVVAVNKLGIGTTTPGDRLHVYEAGTGAAWRGRALFGGQTNVVVAGEYNGVASIGAHNAALNAWAPLTLNFGGGNVGIGTTSPSRELSINGATNAYLSFDEGDTESWVVGYEGGSNNRFIIYGPASSRDYRMVILDNGNVGIGTTTPTAPLHLFGAGDGVDQLKISSTGGTVSEYGFLGANASTNSMRYGYWTGSGYGNHHFEGNVGIGTTNPTYKLVVNGSLLSYGNTVLAYSSGVVGIGGYYSSNMGSYKVAINSGSATNPALLVTGYITASDGSSTVPGYTFATNTGAYGIGHVPPVPNQATGHTSIIANSIMRLAATDNGAWAHTPAGSSSVYVKTANFGYLYAQTSREITKERITSISQAGALTRIAALRPVEFAYKEEAVDLGLNTMVVYDTKRGFIAEEVAAVDHWMAAWGWVDPDDPYKVINDINFGNTLTVDDLADSVPIDYDDRAIVADLVAVVQQMNARLNALEA